MKKRQQLRLSLHYITTIISLHPYLCTKHLFHKGVALYSNLSLLVYFATRHIPCSHTRKRKPWTMICLVFIRLKFQRKFKNWIFLQSILYISCISVHINIAILCGLTNAPRIPLSKCMYCISFQNRALENRMY
jgi:thiosulfate reductase cytochrome b subunit